MASARCSPNQEDDPFPVDLARQDGSCASRRRRRRLSRSAPERLVAAASSSSASSTAARAMCPSIMTCTLSGASSSEALIVGDQHHAHLLGGRRGPHGCPSRRCAARSMSSPESVSSSTARLGFEDRHLHHLVASSTAGEALVQVAVDEGGVHAERAIHSIVARRSSSTERLMPLRLTGPDARNLDHHTPAISWATWNAKDMPALARTLVGQSVMSSPSNQIRPAVTSYSGRRAGCWCERALARAVRAHDRLHLPVGRRGSTPRRISTTRRSGRPDGAENLEPT